MASRTELANMAISHIGIGKEIANIDTEQSEEASACRRYFDTARDAALRDFPWSFATVVSSLSLVSEDPTEEWAYEYRYPADCVKIIRLLSGVRNDTRQSRVPYQVLSGTSARVIYSDEEDAQVEYVKRVTDPSFYPSDFQMAFSFRLAAYIAPRIAKGDPFGLRDKAMQMYEIELSKAKEAMLNEQQVDEEVESEFVRMRE